MSTAPMPPRSSSTSDLAGGAPLRSGDQATRLRALVRSIDAQRQASGVPVAAEPLVAPRPPIIAIASGKGGVGKSNLSVNLSAQLARSGVRTVLIDADVGMADADVLCGMKPRARLNEALETGSTTLWDLAVRAPGGFWLVPGVQAMPSLARTTKRDRTSLLQQVEGLSGDADAILIDLSAGMGPEVTALLDHADVALIVCTPEPTSIIDAYGLLKCLATRDWPEDGPAEPPRLGLLVNQVRHEVEAREVHQRLIDAASRFLGVSLPLLGWVRSDRAVPQAVRDRKPFVLRTPRAGAARDVTVVAQRLRHAVIDPVKEKKMTARAQALLNAFR